MIPQAAKRLEDFGNSKTPNNISDAPLIQFNNNLSGNDGGIIEI